MHRMTRLPEQAEIAAPFDGAPFRFKRDSLRLELKGAARFVRLAAAGEPERLFRVTRVIGGRYREDFAGVEVAASGDGARGDEDEWILPVSFMRGSRTLRLKGYSVMVHERPGLRVGAVWNRTCIFCHNTQPYFSTLLGPIAGPGAPVYQGTTVDRLLPEALRTRVEVTDASALARAVADELRALGATPEPATATQAIRATRARFKGRHLIEVGIGCEACHGGSREHARDPRLRPSFTAVAPWLEVTSPQALPSGPSPAAVSAPASAASKDAQAINRACARCHQVLFSRYPFTWEGGRRDGAAGGSHINSGEARDFLLGGCAGAMACTRCHDPHGADRGDQLRALATPAGNATCTGCHSELADRQRLKDHAHHDPEGAGGSCVACHMPRKNMGLDGTLTRYHRIGSPTDPARVLGDRPLECALCHADRSAGSLVDAMERWWPVRYPRQRIAELYGSLDANVMRATLELGKPHEQAVAMATLGAARDRAAVPLLTRQLLGAYPLVREWARRALTSVLGRCDVDLAADDATIARQAMSCGGAPPAAPLPAARAADEDPED
jgi:predicted CXXCH cytochrome family protein